MKNERIFLVDNMEMALDGFAKGIELFGDEDGHKVIGKASSVKEVETLMKTGIKPTVALVDHRFPMIGDGQRAAEIIKQHSPETFIISFSSDTGLTWGQENWYKAIRLADLVKALTDLQH